MTLIILQAADRFILAVSSPSQVAPACQHLARPVTAYHWREVDPHKQDAAAPVWGWQLEDTMVIA